MRKPVIPVSRFRPFIGQPPTAGIPSHVSGGLRITSRTTRNFIAGAVIILGIIPDSGAGDIHNEQLQIRQVRNDRQDGRVINFGIPPGARKQTDFIFHLGLKTYNVRNDRRDGKVIQYNPPTKTKVEPHFYVHRKPLNGISRFRPWFGALPPYDIIQSDARKFGDFKVSQTFNNWPRPGRVIITGPRLTGESAIVTPKPNTRLYIIQNRWPYTNGRVITFGAPRATFALNVERRPTFKVVSNRSSYEFRRPKGNVIRFIPKDFTYISFGPLRVFRGNEIVIFGQDYRWGPRRVNFIPAIEQRVPKPLKIFRRQVIPYGGSYYRFEPSRETPTVAQNILGSKGLKVFSWRHEWDRGGNVLIITHFKRNPPPTGSTNHGLIRLSEFRIILSVKRENDGGKADVFAADTNGTVINFNKSFKIVESITVTPLNTALQTATYNFTHTTQNPTSFTAKLFDNTGARVNGTVSWKARGIL